MPDVFVAPDEKQDDVVMHQRVPLPTPAKTEEFVLAKAPDVQKSSDTDSSEDETAPADALVDEATEPEETKEEQPTKEVTKNPFTDDLSLFQGKERKNAAIPLFTSFWQNPQGVYFDTQEANEHILLFLRRHFVTNFPWIFMGVVFSILPPLLFYVLNLLQYPLTFLPSRMIFIVILGYYIVVLTYAYLHFLDWYYNISLITAKRVMDIEMKDLIYKKISATKISLVQDITYQQSGAIRTVFNYGEVLIQTAGAEDNFFVNAVPRPEVVVRVVEELIGKKGNDDAGI